MKTPHYNANKQNFFQRTRIGRVAVGSQNSHKIPVEIRFTLICFFFLSATLQQHSFQSNCTLCILTCFPRSLEHENALSHTGHLNGFSP